MRLVCGEEDTWDRGTLPHPEQAPPPVAMQLSVQGEDATARPKKSHRLYRDQGLTLEFSQCGSMNGIPECRDTLVCRRLRCVEAEERHHS